MKWEKRGLVYAPKGNLWWAKTHAFIPTADVSDEALRIYFTSLDGKKFGRIGYVDLDPNNPNRILFVSPEPVLDLGELGTFDDSGVNASCVLSVEGKKYLYYIGWQRAERVPYMLFGGLAISEDGGKTFSKYSRVPVLDRTAQEPFSRSAPFVRMKKNGFQMWYWSCVKWTIENQWVHYNNEIRYAESNDGIHWQTAPNACIVPQDADEYSIGRPWVICDGANYKMWYSIRSRTRPYRIGYAESFDGINWERKDDEVGIEMSARGWDSEMICFPCVVDVGGKRYMFYNGNRHGETGFGIAEWVGE